MNHTLKMSPTEEQSGSIGQATFPFLKWLGGKRWLLPWLENKLSDLAFERYLEPFLGGGSVFFYFKFQGALLSDINSELINTYIQVRDKPDDLIEGLKIIDTDAKSFYSLRDEVHLDDALQKAIRFIYLNRTAFGGMYRVNAKGQYNVPFGNLKNTTAIIWEKGLVHRASKALQGTDLQTCDFEVTLGKAKLGDLVYCDPTYTTMHDNNGFRKYNEPSFTWADQIRLSKCCQDAAARGATVVVSNACHKEVQELYQGFDAFKLERSSVLCPDPSKRKKVNEYVFINKIER